MLSRVWSKDGNSWKTYSVDVKKLKHSVQLSCAEPKQLKMQNGRVRRVSPPPLGVQWHLM